MRTGNLTISETVSEILSALQDYIEASYHISDPSVVKQRRLLIEQEGILFRSPYIESTPRYTPGRLFAQLDIPEPARVLFREMASSRDAERSLLNDPPYSHQAIALEAATKERLSLVITTGTGSGKTESFLLPILAKLAVEAHDRPDSFVVPALRAILLYPMNALVNDQLGRLRLLFGDRRVVSYFTRFGNRPARFARYTSRTLYPGVRKAKKDQIRLRSIERFYISLLQKAGGMSSPEKSQAADLIANLKRRGKWPAKPDLEKWFGRSGQRWQDRDGNFVRALMQKGDPELLTRHEVLAYPPDLLVTNYSMLEYMLMRPLERPVFDATRQWLAENPTEQLLIVVDEAHLYRGAAGAEVALLLRRLRSRLGIPPDRLQVICTSASFNDPDYAREFASQLSGKAASNFRTIQGSLYFRPNAAKGSAADAKALASVGLEEFYSAEDDSGRVRAIDSFLQYRGVQQRDDLGLALFEALDQFPPMSLLVNVTMREAKPLTELGEAIFAIQDRVLAARAVTALIALGSIARRKQDEAGLLPCRVHGFFRGLPGLWACLDRQCSELAETVPRSPIGRLYAQPRDSCECGARTFELFTCRNCGTCYARAYTDNLEEPQFLWNEPGGSFESGAGHVTELVPIDLLLEDPISSEVEPAELDLVTGRLNPSAMGKRMRRLFLKRDRLKAKALNSDERIADRDAAGEFRPCGVCGQQAGYGRSSVQDHQTKGDQPFQALVTRQIEVQPPGPQPSSEFAPLRGRKVLAFSDSRQTAARLAPNLQNYSLRDLLRPLILRGWRELDGIPMLAPSLSLEDIYLSVLVSAQMLGVRLRPELKGTESLHVMKEVTASLNRGALRDPAELFQLLTLRAEPPPQSLLRGIVVTVTDRFYGLQSLALASIRERRNLEASLCGLPELPGIASTNETKLALVRLWIAQWAASPGIWFQSMNLSWWLTKRGVRHHSGKFQDLTRWIGDKQANKAFERDWLPVLLTTFCEFVAPGKYKMRAATLALQLEGPWAYCLACRTTQRPFTGLDRCVNCGRNRLDLINPDLDPVFSARKRFYRTSSVRALANPPDPPLAIIAAEHTAQLNAAQSDEVFSKAEEHELLFQDVNLGTPTSGEEPRAAIDVLSCTTTMEVGIDIGTLSGVALRNMPPSRASYQQRSGRAGRRGNAVATVIAFGSADSHDEHYFSEPDAMIRGRVEDPVLTLDNAEIARRHLTAFLFQRYHEARLPEIDPDAQPQLFEVLGSVEAFRQPSSPLNRQDFETWLRENETQLQADANSWLPVEIAKVDRDLLLKGLVDETLAAVDPAIEGGEVHSATPEPVVTDGSTDDAVVVEAPAEEGEERASPRRSAENLLDRLLYKGVLPRYAFPTDVVSFYVFDRERSTRFRPEYLYAPSQGLPVALTQYAPGKRVWIDGKEWTSGALFAPISDDRHTAWRDRQLYFECSICHYASTESTAKAARGEMKDCPACGTNGSFGGAKNWIRPPGFAHPQSWEEETSSDDQPVGSYATRAKLVASGPTVAENWDVITAHIRGHYKRRPLLVTNTGPRGEGYTYCTRCGLIEPTAIPSTTVIGPHPKPYPDEKDPNCQGSAATRGLVLGTDFISDVLLLSLRVQSPLTLPPGFLATQVALRTLAEAISIAATRRLQIEAGEVQAEFRPALTEGGHQGLEAEIYVYDTLAGGAGFARRIAAQGKLLFEDTIALLEDCPAKCDRSCYRCLRSFKNRFEHALLDRHIGASLLRYLVTGAEPTLNADAAERSAERLFADLSRRSVAGVEFSRNVKIDIPGIGAVVAPIIARSRGQDFIVGIHGALTPDFANDKALRDAKEFGSIVPVILVDEILVNQNLPRASQQVVAAIS